jgi:hypothetical protein
MARSSGKGKKSNKSKKGDRSGQAKKGKDEPKAKKGDGGYRSRFTPVRTAAHESTDAPEVTAGRAFLTSFVLFTLILGPVIGMGVYFARTADAINSVFPTKEGAFMGGMAIGILLALIVSVVFTRKAVAQS